MLGFPPPLHPPPGGPWTRCGERMPRPSKFKPQGEHRRQHEGGIVPRSAVDYPDCDPWPCGK